MIIRLLNIESESGSTEIVIIFAVVFVLAVAALWASKRFPKIKEWGQSAAAALGALLPGGKTNADTAVKDIDALIAEGGYAYDKGQGVFYTRKDAWQRKYGYCRLYDEAAAPLGMIIDCEPVTFDYGGKQWMIEFWKGQYDFTTGCEVGVYTASHDVNIGSFHGTFYDSVGDSDMPYITMTLYKNGQALFKRSGRHWWQTGFMLGEFSEPSELSVHIRITLKNKEMSDAFVDGLYRTGYTENEIERSGSTVSVNFGTPRTTQPSSRTPRIEYLAQWKNKYFCDRYQKITQGYSSMPEKLDAMRSQSPEMFKIMIAIGRQGDVFASFDMISGETE